MANRHKQHITYGASVSSIVCDNYDIDIHAVIEALAHQLQIKRFRLMSYWNQLEATRGKYAFDQLDQQIAHVEKLAGSVTLCLGMRQPRWPECHVPEWATQLSKKERDQALLTFIEATVKRYKVSPVIESYQLENEALNRGIGVCQDYDRARLRAEFELVKRIDASRPIVMTTSNSWGLPLRRPIPNAIGFSYYLYQWEGDGPSRKPIPWQVHWLRARLAQLVLRRSSFCHELQAEPWGPEGTESLSDTMQRNLMDAARLTHHLEYAIKTGVTEIDLWGAEWWYWRKQHHKDSSAWDAIALFTNQP